MPNQRENNHNKGFSCLFSLSLPSSKFITEFKIQNDLTSKNKNLVKKAPPKIYTHKSCCWKLWIKSSDG